MILSKNALSQKEKVKLKKLEFEREKDSNVLREKIVN